MWTPPTLSEARRVAGNKANFQSLFGQPDNWMDAERTLNEMRPQSPNTNPQSPTPGTLIPPGPMRRTNPLDPTAPPRFFGAAPTPYGQVPDAIKAANPEAYFDERLGSTVIGASGRNRNAIGGSTWAGNAVKNGQVMQNTNTASFGMPAPNERSGTIGGRATPAAPDMFGRQFGQPSSPPPMGTTTDGNQSFAPKPWEIPGYASGGEVEGPGGPKDDMVPAMLSDGEFVMPAEAVKFFGLDRLEKMKAKAKEGLMEMKANQPDTMHKGMMHMAAGGFVNPYADDPALYARRQQEARDASLATAGIADMGGGNMTLNNRYGTGYAVPTTQGLPDMPGRFNNGGNTVTAAPGKGLSMVPDVLPPGPWAAPALPWEAKPQRENIAFMQQQMIPGAEGRRADDLATDTRFMATQPKGRRIITVPDARPNFGYGPGQVSAGEEHYREGHFLSPSEKDAQAAAARNAPVQPFLDAGMKKSDIRRMMRTPQGVASMMEMQAARNKAPANQAMPVIMPDGSPSKTHYMVNGMTLPFGGDADQPKRIKELDALIADQKQPLHIRELAKRERERAAKETIQGGGEVKAPKLAQVPGGIESNWQPVNVQWDAKTGGWAPIQMAGGNAGAAPAAATPAPNAAADRIAALRKKAGL